MTVIKNKEEWEEWLKGPPDSKYIYPPCKHCGKSHKMGVEDMETGEITPIDICSDCLWKPAKAINAVCSEELKEYHRNSYVHVNLNYGGPFELRKSYDIMIRDLINSTKIKFEEGDENENTSCT